MRTDSRRARSLCGQLLRAAVDGPRVTLDCILAKEGAATGWPVTLVATVDWAAPAPHRAVAQLRRWADEATPVEVTLCTGPDGPKVLVTSASTLVVLEPIAPAPAAD
ncbi:MAG: hypothetical protein ACR2KK_19455 [Acidimicrobiales bacterium]